MKKLGILLCNIGTPDAPTKKAVRRYLKEFLSDRRVIEFPKVLWQPLLRTLILPFRSKKSAKLYEKIWTEKGSPLLTITNDLVAKLQHSLSLSLATECVVVTAMRYGQPSINDGLDQLRAADVECILVLPLFPQYSATTTASTYDAVAKSFTHWRKIPEGRMVNSYFDHPAYIKSISKSVQEHWQKMGKKFLLFSFHGIPQRYVDLGDPYAEQCHTTAALIAKELDLSADEWIIAFQSRLGPTKWLQPYTDKVLEDLPKKNIVDIDVVCPGFPIDCLETLEEIAMRGKEFFLEAGGKNFEFIPGLNSEDVHVQMLEKIIEDHIQGWDVPQK